MANKLPSYYNYNTKSANKSTTRLFHLYYQHKPY